MILNVHRLKALGNITISGEKKKNQTLHCGPNFTREIIKVLKSSPKRNALIGSNEIKNGQ